MGTTLGAIKRWFDRGAKEGAAYMIVVCDTFDHEDYPVYIMPNQDFWEEYEHYNQINMQRIMEVYNFGLSWEKQSKGRVHNTPPRKQIAPQNEYKEVEKQSSKKKLKIGQRKVKHDTQ